MIGCLAQEDGMPSLITSDFGYLIILTISHFVNRDNFTQILALELAEQYWS